MSIWAIYVSLYLRDYGRKFESIIQLFFAKRTQSVKRNAGQVSCIKVDISSTYQENMKQNRIGRLVKTNPNEANPSNKMPDGFKSIFEQWDLELFEQVEAERGVFAGSAGLPDCRQDFEAGDFELFMLACDAMADNPAESCSEDDIARPVVAGIHHPVGNERCDCVGGNADLRPIKFVQNGSDCERAGSVAARPCEGFAVRRLVVSGDFQRSCCGPCQEKRIHHRPSTPVIEIVLIFSAESVPYTGDCEMSSRMADYVEAFVLKVAKRSMPFVMLCDFIIGSLVHNNACTTGQREGYNVICC
jgi:hypothetical protein